ncbi:hypothetical protein VCHC17A1_3997B, partial [Vibrio cholerae HC-17A1]
TRSY